MTASLLFATMLLTACGEPVDADPTNTCVDPPEPARFVDEAPPPDDGTTIAFIIVTDYGSAGVDLEITAGTGGIGAVLASTSVDFIGLVPENLARVGETVDMTMRAQGLVETVPNIQTVVYSEAYLSFYFGAPTDPEPPLQLNDADMDATEAAS